jgi:hypothetical protein
MNCTATTVLTPSVRIPPGPSATRPARRRRAWLTALLVAGLAPSAWATEVTFYKEPTDSTVVAGHQICFYFETNASANASYQWYRNGVAIFGATAQSYAFTAQSADNGARYQAVVEGDSKTGGGHAGPTASASATLTVLPAGTALPPQLTAPEGDTVWYVSVPGFYTYAEFRARGNGLSWQYRFDTDPAGQWRAPATTYVGSQSFLIGISPPTGTTTISVRVTDDAGAVAERTWRLAPDQPPVLVTAPTAVPNPMIYPGPATLSVSASDPDGDPLTYTWRVVSAPGVVPTFVPNGTADSAVCTARFPLANADYTIVVTISDGKGAVIEAAVPLSVQLPAGLDARADVNGDGVINALDLGIVTDNFGKP